jgi:hypothetical protein
MEAAPRAPDKASDSAGADDLPEPTMKYIMYTPSWVATDANLVVVGGAVKGR